eukprot:s1874_g14.t1
MVLRHYMGVVRTPKGYPGVKCDEGCWVNIMDILVYNWIWDDGYDISMDNAKEDVLAERLHRLSQFVWYEVKALKTVRFQVVALKLKLGDLRSPTLSQVVQMTQVDVDNLIGPDQEEVWMWPVAIRTAINGTLKDRLRSTRGGLVHRSGTAREVAR